MAKAMEKLRHALTNILKRWKSGKNQEQPRRPIDYDDPEFTKVMASRIELDSKRHKDRLLKSAEQKPERKSHEWVEVCIFQISVPLLGVPFVRD